MAFNIPDIVEDIDWTCLCRGCELYDDEAGYCSKYYAPDETNKCKQKSLYYNFFDALYSVENIIRAISEVRDEDDLDALRTELEKFK